MWKLLLRMRRCGGALAGANVRPGTGDVIGASAAAIEAAASKHENNKCAFVDAGVHMRLISAAAVASGSPNGGPGAGEPVPPPPSALGAICGALRSFATADDLRPSTSRCLVFQACSYALDQK